MIKTAHHNFEAPLSHSDEKDFEKARISVGLAALCSLLLLLKSLPYPEFIG